MTESPTPTGTPSRTATATWTSTVTLTPTATRSSTPSYSPTLTPTPTITDTPSATHTPTLTPSLAATGVVIGLPYPDPDFGPDPVTIQVQAPAGSGVEWSVYTTAFRKILDVSEPIPGTSATLVWNLEDAWQKPVANGLYFMKIQVTGPVKATKILKILVIR